MIEKILRKPLPILLMGDFNAHHPYWLDKDANKLGNKLFDFLVDKDLVVPNNSQPTRKDKIIDLTIISNSLQEKVSSWRVQKEVYLNTDHSLITFNIGVKLREESVIRYDFKKTNWVEWEKSCTEALEEWLETRKADSNVNEDYESLVPLIHEKAEYIIPKKQVCRHSKGWWNQELTCLSKEFKKAKRLFAMVEVLHAFKEEEARARNQYLEEMVKLMDPRKPDQFRKVVSKERKNLGKSVVQPISREDGS